MTKIAILLCMITLITRYGIADNTLFEFSDIFNIFSAKIQLGESSKSTGHNKDFKKLSNTTPEKFIRHYNYKGEKHLVETEDGYTIALHRIAGNETHPNSKGKPVVLLQHGLACNAMTWLVAGPDRSLAFILADLGFDVWLGNARGTDYSRKHKQYKVNQHKFWDFSWHEIGVYDLPAKIDYILKTTRRKKIIYIGHSQGTASSYVMLSERPEYNKKISSLISLAPTAFYHNVKPASKLIAQATLLLDVKQYYEVFGVGQIKKNLRYTLCNQYSLTHQICKMLLFMSHGYSQEQFDPEVYSLLFKYYPTATSIKQVFHYAQLMVSGNFRKYNYGKDNVNRYNSMTPPNYNLQNIKVPTTLFCANNDLLTSAKDVEYLYNQLPNPNGLYVVEHPTFNHLDFLFGKDLQQLVYDKLIPLLLRASKH